MPENLSAKYYQENKERLQKKLLPFEKISGIFSGFLFPEIKETFLGGFLNYFQA